MERLTTAILLSALVLSGCGGGSSGSDPNHPLTGTWYGTADLLTNQGNYGTVEATFDSEGKLVEVVLDGSALEVTATEADFSNGIYTYEASSGELFALRKFNGDSLAYVDSGDYVALLTKGASSRPTYELTETTGEFSGKEFITDSAYNLLNVLSVNATIEGNSTPLSVTFKDSQCEASADLNLASSTAGVYTGTFTNTAGSNCLQSGSLKHYLGADKESILTVACTSFDSFDVPQNCAFITGAKQ